MSTFSEDILPVLNIEDVIFHDFPRKILRFDELLRSEQFSAAVLSSALQDNIKVERTANCCSVMYVRYILAHNIQFLVTNIT